MKICSGCSAQVDDNARFCPICGSTVASQSIGEQFDQQMVQTSDSAIDPDSALAEKNNGNILKGLLGAVLFSLGGVLLYCVLYQLNILAAISCILMFTLAYKGYGKFSGAKDSYSPVGLALSVIIMIIMIFMAEYISLGITLFIELAGDGYTLVDSFLLLPAILEESEVAEAVGGDLAFAYIFALISVIANIISIKKARKKKGAK